MGMFDWLKSKQKLDEEYAGNVPPRPIPQPITAAPKNISEPVSTLLKMLDNDEWETGYNCEYSYGYTSTKTLKNLYNEEVTLTLIEHRSMYADCGSTRLEGYNWMTPDEKSVVIEKLLDRHSKTEQANSEHMMGVQREAFARKLGVK